MRQQRWFQIAVLAIGLFAINVATRLVIRLGFNGDGSAEDRASIVMFGLIGLALAAFTFFRAQRVAPSTWLPDLSFGAVGGMLLTILIGPLVSGDAPFSGGAGFFFSQIWLYAGFGIVGTLLGYWIATALGRDYRSRSLKAFAQARTTRPRKVVRR
jgi:hypothetical protein